MVSGRNTKKKLSIKHLILYIFMPLISVVIILCGPVSYAFIQKSVKEMVSANTLNSVTQATRYINAQLSDTFQEFVLLSRFRTLAYEAERGGNRKLDELMLSVYGAFSDIYSANANLLDTLYLAFEQKDGTIRSVYYSERWLESVNISLDGEIGGIHLSSEEAASYNWAMADPRVLFTHVGAPREEEPVLTLFKTTTDAATGQRFFILFMFKREFFDSVLLDSDGLGDYSLALFNTDGELIDLIRNYEGALDAEAFASDKERGVLEVYDGAGERLLYIYDTIAINSWQLAVIVNFDDIFAFLNTFQLFTAAFTVTVLIVSLFISYASVSMITTPINRWSKKIMTISESNLDITFDETNCAEIAQLNIGLNYLIKQVRGLLKKNEQDYEEKRGLELALLQSQIQPHFLYNTLYSIQQLYELGDSATAHKMTSDLAAFFRLSLGSGKDEVPLRDEIAHVTSYLDIEQLRHDNLHYRIICDELILDCSIVKLTIQPLVENAINHGIYGRENGEIIIRAFPQEENIIIEVQDNGAGITLDRRDALQYALEIGDWSGIGRSFGLHNVHERLRIYYGAPYGLSIASEPDRGTTMRIVIPQNP